MSFNKTNMIYQQNISHNYFYHMFASFRGNIIKNENTGSCSRKKRRWKSCVWKHLFASISIVRRLTPSVLHIFTHTWENIAKSSKHSGTLYLNYVGQTGKMYSTIHECFVGCVVLYKLFDMKRTSCIYMFPL